MKLYLVRGNDAHGENQDLFVVAPDGPSAVDVWNDYLVANNWSRSDYDAEISLPRKTTVKPANIREILPDVTNTQFAGPARGIDWSALPIIQ